MLKLILITHKYFNMASHIPNQRIKERSETGPHLTRHEHLGINGRLALFITDKVGSMWCAYIFALIALISLPAAIEEGTSALVSWVTQTFLQLVLLSVILVGQKVAAQASDKRAMQTYKDTEALLKLQDEIHRLIKINTKLTEETRDLVMKRSKE